MGRMTAAVKLGSGSAAAQRQTFLFVYAWQGDDEMEFRRKWQYRLLYFILAQLIVRMRGLRKTKKQMADGNFVRRRFDALPDELQHF
jgi:hypothetical protein